MILTDTREQLPLWKRSTRCKLEVGDYTTDKLKNVFHIERKSGADLYGSLIQSHVRFSDMFSRAEVYGIRIALFIECSKTKFVNLKFQNGHKRNMKPETLLKIVDSFVNNRKDMGLEIVWCGSRRSMQRCVLERFKLEEHKLKRK